MPDDYESLDDRLCVLEAAAERYRQGEGLGPILKLQSDLEDARRAIGILLWAITELTDYNDLASTDEIDDAIEGARQLLYPPPPYLPPDS